MIKKLCSSIIILLLILNNVHAKEEYGLSSIFYHDDHFDKKRKEYCPVIFPEKVHEGLWFLLGAKFKIRCR